ncbi:cation:proton antiporter [Ardenticatena maritima]|nr:cation:proton antiporter [Ardenticatena maritima]
MSATLVLFLTLSIVLLTAKGLGWLSTRFDQPAVLGELLAGLILGPTVLGLLGWPIFAEHHETMQETFHLLAELGVLVLMFLAGLEIEPEEFFRSGAVAVWAGVSGVVVPLVLGALLALLFGYPGLEAVFIGIILTATSVSISAQTLMELGYLRSKVGIALLGAAVVDDVLGILILSLFVALAGAGSTGAGLVWLVVRMVLFLVGGYVVGRAVLPRFVEWMDEIPLAESMVAAVLAIMFIYGWAAETLGAVAPITGTFLAGLILTQSRLQHKIADRLFPIAFGFLVPVFLVNIGLNANLRVLNQQQWLFGGLLVLVAVLGKVVGCGVGARLGGFEPRAAFQLGVGMISRGEVGLIVATIGLSQGVIGADIFAVTVLMVLATTLLTPPLLRWALRLSPEEVLEESGEPLPLHEL